MNPTHIALVSFSTLAVILLSYFLALVASFLSNESEGIFYVLLVPPPILLLGWFWRKIVTSKSLTASAVFIVVVLLIAANYGEGTSNSFFTAIIFPVTLGLALLLGGHFRTSMKKDTME